MTETKVPYEVNGAIAAAVDAALAGPRTLPVDPLNAKRFELIQAEIIRAENARHDHLEHYLAAAGLLPLRDGMQWALQKIEGRLCVVEQPTQGEG